MDRRFFYQSGALALGFYVFFLFVLFLNFYSSLNTKPKVISFKQETVFEISLVQSSDQALQTDNAKKQIDAQDPKTIQDDGSLTHKRGPQLDSLFSNIQKTSVDTLEEYQETTRKTPIVSRKYGQKKKVIAKNISKIDRQLAQMSLPQSHSPQSDYNAYYSKINKLLTAEFNARINVVGSHKAIVLFEINDVGKATYSVTQWSQNGTFDDKLKAFLNAITQKTFPPYVGGSTLIKVIFETKE